MRERISIVISTYEWPEALDTVLRALTEQSDPRFDVVVADDGSGPQTEAVVESWRPAFGRRLTHVWQSDDGFRVARARNLGALTTGSDYLVFLDGDCVPRQRFVSAVRAAARPGWFVVGRRLLLSSRFTDRVLRRRLPVHRWSSVEWLARAHRHGQAFRNLTAVDRRRVGRPGVPEFVPQGNAYSPLGMAARDFVRADGFDMRYEGWGEEDVDIAVRLKRLGLRCGHAGPHATVAHLWHPVRERRERPNWWLLRETEHGRRVEARHGLRELSPPADASVA